MPDTQGLGEKFVEPANPAVTNQKGTMMRTRSKLLLAALSAAALLSLAVGNASARRIETSSQSIRTVWPAGERLKFVGGGGLVNIECEVTIEGSFHSRTLSKVCGQLVGYITRAEVTRPCNGGNAWILNGVERLANGTTTTSTLPWHIRYASFRGTLPRIEGIRLQLVGAAFLLEHAFGECLYQSTAARPAFGIVEVEASGGVTGLRADEEANARIPLKENLAGLCDAEGTFSRKGGVTQQGSSTRITVRLVQ